jgi:hypothetical protein
MEPMIIGQLTQLSTMDTHFSKMWVSVGYQAAVPGSQAIQLPQHHRVQLQQLLRVQLHLPFRTPQQMQ